jgi:hypothetical protein
MIAKLILLGLGLGLMALAWRRWQRRARLDFIAGQPLPRSLRPQLIAQYPEWGEAQLAAVERGLRQFFRLCARSPGRFVAMPSKAVDAAWHACILDTRAYERYCRNAFGRMLHHSPAEALPASEAPSTLRQGLRRAWWGACRDEGLNPRQPVQLPLLFALDADLGIPGGYRYVPDCRLLGADRGDTHCAAALACGGSSGSSNDGRSDGDGGGDGGGCGGGD